jgi:hypothetical protein
MDCIKTEPDPDAEVHSASCREMQLVDVKREEQPVSISFPAAEGGSDVSCQLLMACGSKVVSMSVANGMWQ